MAPTLKGYENVTLVGRGGFAVVYRAWQSSFNRMVAVKVLAPQSLDARSYRLFERERVALGALSSHPNIVTVYDSGITEEGAPFLVMEYVTGGSLADRLGHVACSWHDGARIGVKLSGALETAHRTGVLHRDIKPENVLMSAFGEPQLADFGIVRLLSSHDTRSLEVKLSVPFAPPELLDGAMPSVGSDVYSLACTVHSLMLGRPSFLSEQPERNSLLPLMVRIHGDPPPDLRPNGVPDELCTVVERAMAKDPRDRQATAYEFGTQLRAAAEAAGGLAIPLPLAEPAHALVAERPDHPNSGVAVRHPTSRLPVSLSQAGGPRPTRRRPGLYALPVVALLALGVAAAVATGSEGGDGDPTTTTIGPTSASSEVTTSSTSTPTTSTSSPPTTAVSPELSPLPDHTDPLPPGHYILAGLRPRVAIRLKEGWRRPRADRPDLVELVPTATSAAGLVSFFTVKNVVDPGRTFASVAEARDPGSVSAAPEDLVAWLGGHPRLTVEEPVPVRAAALSGNRVDIAIRQKNSVCTRAATPCVVLFQLDRTAFVLLPENHNRFYIFQTGGTTTVVTVEAQPEHFAELAAAAEQIVSTLEFLPTP